MVDGSLMMALGMTALHLRIADFKFTHTFIICIRLPDTEILFGIDIQKKCPCHMPGIRKITAAYRKTVDFSLTLETLNGRQQYKLSNQLSKDLLDIMAVYQSKSKDTQLKDI